MECMRDETVGPMVEECARRRAPGRGGGLGAGARAVAVVALALSLATSVAAVEPQLLGATLTWAVNPNFRPQEASSSLNDVTRTVTFTLRTAWKMEWVGGFGDCQVNVGEAVLNPDNTWFSRCGSQQTAFGNLSIFACDSATNPCSFNKVTPSATVRNNMQVFETHQYGKRPSVWGDSGSVAIMSGEFKYTYTVPDSKEYLFAYLHVADPSSSYAKALRVFHTENRVYFGTTVLGIFLVPDGQARIAPTSVRLCVKANCRPVLDGSHVQNYYSPVPAWPLVVFAPPDASTQVHPEP